MGLLVCGRGSARGFWGRRMGDSGVLGGYCLKKYVDYSEISLNSYEHMPIIYMRVVLSMCLLLGRNGLLIIEEVLVEGLDSAFSRE